MAEPESALVRAVARLAGLAPGPEEVEREVPIFGRLLAAFHVLAEADVRGLEPLYAPGEPAPEPAAPPSPAGDEAAARAAAILAQAPERVGDSFAVPRTVAGAEEAP